MHEVSTKTKIGLWIFTVAAVSFGGLEIYGVTEHASNPSWPHHALFHAVTGLFDELLLCVFILLLTWKVVRHGQRWGWWTLLAIGATVYGGLLVGNVFSHGGLSGGGESLGHPEVFVVLAITSVVLWAIALALTWSHVNNA